MSLYIHLTTLLLASVAAAASLVAIWTATSRRHWFWRALAIWSCVAAMLPIRAYEPAMVFAVALPLLAGSLVALRLMFRGHTPEKKKFRFGLRDLFVTILLAGATLAVWRYLAQQVWPIEPSAVIAPALAIATVASLSFWAATGPRRAWAISVLMCAIALAAWWIQYRLPWLYEIDALDGYRREAFQTRNYDYPELSLFGGGLTEFAGLVILGVFLIRTAPQKWRQFKRIAAIVIAAPMVGLAAWLYWQMFALTPFPPPLVAADNHGAEILQIAERAKWLFPMQQPSGDRLPATSVPEKAEDLNRLYAELLQLLESPNSMPFDPAADSRPDFITRIVADRTGDGRVLSQCLSAEARDARAHCDYTRAATMAIARLRLGSMFCRNCLDVEALVGYAILGGGHADLIRIRRSLDSDEAARAIAELIEAEQAHEPIERIHQRDIAFTQRAYGWQARLSQILADKQAEGTMARSFKGATDRWLAVGRLLVIDLAIRRYQRDHGSWPTSLDELARGYLLQVPLDPFSGGPFVYRVESDDFLLYSVNRDGYDDGGQFPEPGYPPIIAPGNDLGLDTLVRP